MSPLCSCCCQVSSKPSKQSRSRACSHISGACMFPCAPAPGHSTHRQQHLWVKWKCRAHLGFPPRHPEKQIPHWQAGCICVDSLLHTSPRENLCCWSWSVWEMLKSFHESLSARQMTSRDTFCSEQNKLVSESFFFTRVPLLTLLWIFLLRCLDDSDTLKVVFNGYKLYWKQLYFWRIHHFSLCCLFLIYNKICSLLRFLPC